MATDTPTPSGLEVYALDWAAARRNQGGFLFAWLHTHGQFCHVRRDTFEEVFEFTHHRDWVIVDMATGLIVQSQFEDVTPAPASNSDDIPV